MKFNRFVWELYLQSRRGKSAVRRFSSFKEVFIEEWCRTFPFTFFEEFRDLYPEAEVDIDVPKLVRDAVAAHSFKNQKAASRHYRKVLSKRGFPVQITDKRGKTDVVFTFGDEHEHWYDYVAAISLGLHWAQPNFFLPYNFRRRFNELEEIHTEFGIPLPPIPGKGDKEGRGLYYAAINEAWQEFRHRFELCPAEMCAWLYDFAPQFTTPTAPDALPSPSKVWLATGGAWDIELVDNATPETVSTWGGNVAVRRGDIILLYLVKPRGAIDSIWRAASDGFIDPFFHYHGMITICGHIRTQPVTYAELRAHPLLGRKPAVRACFKGPSSKSACTLEEYEAILAIMASKGQDASKLPRIPLSNALPSVEPLDEREVETQLIEPFLKRLGYKEKDWIRQMPVKMGRGERNYPDYAIGASPKRGEESAKMILESKFQLSALSEYTEAFYQSKSYALRLRSRIMAMAAKEGIWVFPPEDGDFGIKRYVHKGWRELIHPDHFHEVLQLIGRDKVLR
jgi:hypothetical protein